MEELIIIGGFHGGWSTNIAKDAPFVTITEPPIEIGGPVRSYDYTRASICGRTFLMPTDTDYDPDPIDDLIAGYRLHKRGVVDEKNRIIKDLAMLVRRLCVGQDGKKVQQAKNYLASNGLKGQFFR